MRIRFLVDKVILESFHLYKNLNPKILGQRHKLNCDRRKTGKCRFLASARLVKTSMVPLNQEYGQGEKNKIKESSISLSLSLSLSRYTHTHIYNASKINMKRSRPLSFCCFYGQLCHMNNADFGSY